MMAEAAKLRRSPRPKDYISFRNLLSCAELARNILELQAPVIGASQKLDQTAVFSVQYIIGMVGGLDLMVEFQPLGLSSPFGVWDPYLALAGLQ